MKGKRKVRCGMGSGMGFWCIFGITRGTWEWEILEYYVMSTNGNTVYSDIISFANESRVHALLSTVLPLRCAGTRALHRRVS